MTARVIVVATGQLGRPGPAGGVDSVNGETGDVVLDAGDVDAEPAGAVATHAAVTTSVHGVADMTLLETLSGATAKANAAQTAASTAAAVDATTKANTAQSAAATNAATQIAAHAVAADPHADRAYTNAQIAASLSTSFDFKDSVRVATTANITLSGAQTIDGVSVVATNRVLVKNQTTGSQNGIYVASAGAWTRATDADVSAEVTAGMAVPIEEGTAGAGVVFLLTTPNPITLGTTALSFSLIGSGDLRAANNLSDVTSTATALTNLGGVSTATLTAHEIETTDVHGIVDTAVLETVSGSAAKVAAHEIDTTSVHGIANTAFLETQAGAQTKVDTLEDALPAIYVESPDIRHIVTLTQAEYDALTPDADTQYNITDAGIVGATNLGYTAAPTNGVVTSDTGADATLSLAGGTNAGLMSPANFTKLSTAYVPAGTDVAVADGGTGSSIASGARTNLGLGTMAVEAAASYLPLVAVGAAVENIGAVEWNVNVVTVTGSTETLDTSVYGTHKCVMDQNCTFTFSNPAPSGKETEFKLYLSGAFTPTFPASVDWSDGTAPLYETPAIYVFSTIDAGTTWWGSQVGKAFA